MDVHGLFQEVADVIGTAAARVLVERYPGQQILIPGSVTEHWTELLGDLAARRLVAEYRGQSVHVPSQAVLDREARRQQVLADVRGGFTVAEIARRTGLSVRSVHYIKAGVR